MQKVIFVYPIKSAIFDLYSVNASVRYRAYHFSLHYQHYCTFVFVSLEQALNTINLHPTCTVVFLRPYFSKKLSTILSTLKARSIPTYADYDDLLFSEDLLQALAGPSSKSPHIKSLKKDIQNYRKALAYFNNITASTNYLTHKIREIRPEANITTIKNILSPYTYQHIETKAFPETFKEIHYFSGSIRHQQDLDMISQPLSDWLTQDTRHSLILHGSIDIPPQLKGKNVSVKPYCHYLGMQLHLEHAIAAIAPLINTSFNSCKSAVKFLESAQVGIPVIASAIGEYKEIRSGGPLLAQSSEEWLMYLNKLTHDKQFWQACSKKQQQGALHYGSKTAVLPPYLRTLQQKVVS